MIVGCLTSAAEGRSHHVEHWPGYGFVCPMATTNGSAAATLRQIERYTADGYAWRPWMPPSFGFPPEARRFLAAVDAALGIRPTCATCEWLSDECGFAREPRALGDCCYNHTEFFSAHGERCVGWWDERGNL